MGIAEKILERIEYNTQERGHTWINISNLKEDTLNTIIKTLEERRYNWIIHEYPDQKSMFISQDDNFDKKEDEHKYIHIYGVLYPRYHNEDNTDLILLAQFCKENGDYEEAECNLYSYVTAKGSYGNGIPMSQKRRKALEHIIRKLDANNRVFTEVEIEHLDKIGIKIHKENLKIEIN